MQSLVFTKRVAYTHWTAIDTATGDEVQIRPLRDLPVPFLFVYMYDPVSRKLRRETPCKWTAELSLRYFPTKKPVEKFDPLYYSPMPPIIKHWNNARAEKYPLAILKKLAPKRSLDRVKAFVEKGNYSGLVRKIGGVDPAILAAWFCQEESIIQEAHVLFQLTEAMKNTRKVWLHDDDIAYVSTEHLQDAAVNLLEADLIVVKDGRMALSWAAKKHDAFFKQLKIKKCTFEHTPGVKPLALDELNPATQTVFAYDTNIPVDYAVTNRVVLVTMLDVDWANEPDPTIEVIPTVIHASDPFEGLQQVREMLPTYGLMRTLVVNASSMGYTFDRMTAFTCKIITAEDRYPQFVNHQTVLVEETVAFPEKLRVTGRPKGVFSRDVVSVVMDRKIVFATTKSASAMQEAEMQYIANKAYQLVVFVGSSETPLRWKHEAMRLTEDPEKHCIFIHLGST